MLITVSESRDPRSLEAALAMARPFILDCDERAPRAQVRSILLGCCLDLSALKHTKDQASGTVRFLTVSNNWFGEAVRNAFRR